MVIVFEMIGRMKKYVIDANALISFVTDRNLEQQHKSGDCFGRQVDKRRPGLTFDRKFANQLKSMSLSTFTFTN